MTYRVAVRKSDGVPIEWQTGEAPLGTIVSNLVASGQYPIHEIEEKKMTRDEFSSLYFDKIGRQKVINENATRNRLLVDKAVARTRLKTKLGFSEANMRDLEVFVK